jgi:hypothetical protein
MRHSPSIVLVASALLIVAALPPAQAQRAPQAAAQAPAPSLPGPY